MTQKSFCVALTGGIGSGKSTVSQLFEKHGVPVIDADIIARDLVKKDLPAYIEIVKHFGSDVLNKDKTLDRKKLRHIIFKNKTEKKWLEDLLHPEIRKSMREMVSACTAPYCICVIPLFVESNGFDFIDRVLLVESNIDMQIARATSRDNTNPTDIQKIIETQADNTKRRAIADDILENNGSLVDLEKQVVTLHRSYQQNI